MSNLPDIVVAGAGPAGLAAAAALARRGLAVLVVDPRAGEPWQPVYGGWADEFDTLGLGDLAAQRWAAALVYSPVRHRVNRSYLRVDGERLRLQLEGELARHGGRLWRDAATVLRARPGGVRLETARGRSLIAGLVVDASGASGLCRRSASAWQLAYGVEVEVSAHPWGSDMVLMDWRAPGAWGDTRPSFLYAMPHSTTRVFVEETVLATRTPLSTDMLRARLHQRLQSMGVGVRSMGRVETCRIPLDLPPPPARPGVVAFGAAGGMIHPISGYQLARCLRLAEPLSKAAAHSLGSRDGDPAEAARRVVAGPGSARRRSLDLLGLDVLIGLDLEQTQRFFAAFFDMAPGHQKAWLDPDRSSADVVAAMAVMFGGVATPMKRTLLREAMQHVARTLSPNLQARGAA